MARWTDWMKKFVTSNEPAPAAREDTLGDALRRVAERTPQRCERRSRERPATLPSGGRPR